VKIRLAVAALTLLFGAVVPARAAVILGPIVSPINGYTYYLIDPLDWPEAEAEAVSLGGHLVTIRSQEENDWLYTTFGPYAPAPEGFWIGLNDIAVEGNFVWSSGESVTYTNWNVGEPNNFFGMNEDYVHMYGPLSSGASRWNDVWDDNPWGPHPGIVEVTATPVPDPASLLLLGTGLLGAAAVRRRSRS
jgi:hypothetical protein